MVSFKPPRSAIYRMAQVAVGGDLATWLRKRRADGKTYQQIAFELTALGVFVSDQTVRSWWLRIEPPADEQQVSKTKTS